MHRVLTVVINLDRSKDRLEAVTSNCVEQGIEFTRLPAVDGSQIVDFSKAGYKRDAALTYVGRELSSGEVGCYLSHLNALKVFLQGDADYMLVLEDDVEFTHPNVMQLMQASITASATPSSNGIGVANVGLAPSKLTSKVADIDETGFVAAHYFPVTMTAILWGRDAAEGFLKECSQVVYPVDLALQNWAIQNKCGFGMIPAPCRPSDVDSVIAGLGGRPETLEKNNRLKLRTFNRKFKCYSGAILARLMFRTRRGG